MLVIIRLILTCVIFFTWHLSICQITPIIKRVSKENVRLTELARLPKSLKEASGLQSFQKGRFWTHNDGGPSILYCIDTTGKVIKSVNLSNKNGGWEDLAKDRKGNLYIGAFGNNRNDKNPLKIYVLPKPDSITKAISLARSITYTYEDQEEYPPPPENLNFDVDAMVCIQDSLYLFSKNRTKPFNGIINVYSLPNVPGKYVAKKVDSFRLNGSMLSNWITGADLSPDGKSLALLFHNKILIISGFDPGSFSKGQFIEYNLSNFSHKAGICFNDNNSVYIVDELELDVIGGKLYKIQFTNNK